jgi:hypothetical protein
VAYLWAELKPIRAPNARAVPKERVENFMVEIRERLNKSREKSKGRGSLLKISLC